jgi:hypothetical protein
MIRRIPDSKNFYFYQPVCCLSTIKNVSTVVLIAAAMQGRPLQAL